MFGKLQNDRKYVNSEERWEPVRTLTIFIVYMPVMLFSVFVPKETSMWLFHKVPDKKDEE